MNHTEGSPGELISVIGLSVKSFSGALSSGKCFSSETFLVDGSKGECSSGESVSGKTLHVVIRRDVAIYAREDSLLKSESWACCLVAFSEG